MAEYESKHGKALKPVNVRNPKNRVPEKTRCPHCDAPYDYIYFNDGKKRSQLKCKICGDVFGLHIRFRKPNKYFCPYCFKALYTWKEREEATIYKCHNQKCPHRQEKLSALNADEKRVRQERLSQFKINYQYRDYHFQPGDLKVAEPDKPHCCLKPYPQ